MTAPRNSPLTRSTSRCGVRARVLGRSKGAAILSAGLGLFTLATGVYFMAFRPSMLAEDVRFTGVSPVLLGPTFANWLSIVFRTWGGFLVGFGVLLGAVGTFLWSADIRRLRAGVAGGTVFAFGSFLLSNIQLSSSFVWYIGLLFAAAVALAWFLFRRQSCE